MENLPFNGIDENNKKGSNIDRIFSTLKKEYIVIGKTTVRGWYAWLTIGIIAGTASGVLLIASRDGQFELSQAGIEALEKAPSLEDLTFKTLRLKNVRYRELASLEQETTTEDRLHITVQERKKVIKSLMERDPAAVLKVAIPKNLRDEFPEDVRQDIEEEVSLDGDLEVYHVDGAEKSGNFEETGARYEYYLKDAQGKRQSLHFAGDMEKISKQLRHGNKVKIKGVRVDDAVALATADLSTSGSTSGTSALVSGSFGPQRILVILVNFQDDTSRPYTVDDAKTVTFTTLNNFWKENSYNVTTAVGDVAGWYTIPVNKPISATDLNQKRDSIKTNARLKAQAAGFNLSNYNRFVYAFPSTPGWWGSATVGGNPSHAWINGSYQFQVVGHELGHNLGLQHSHSLQCVPNVLGSNCSVFEYGDYFDIMGSPVYRGWHFNAFQKELLGWLGESGQPSIQTVTGSGTFTINPFEDPNINLKALNVPRGSGESFYLEYRRPIGFDAGITPVNTTGIMFHNDIVKDGVESSALLDMSPAVISWGDVVLKAGQAFTDTVAGITFMVTGVNSGGVTVSISRAGTQPCTRANPTVAFSPLGQFGSAGQTLNYTLAITNNDNTVCGTSVFAVSVAVPSGWSRTVSPSSVSIAPGSSANVAVSVTSSATATDGAYTITGTASNSSIPYSLSGSATASYNVAPAPPPPAEGTFFDDFNRPDSSDLDANWTEVNGNLFIQTGELRNSATNGVTHKAVLSSLSGTDQSLEAKFARTVDSPARFGLILRYQNAQNYYFAYRQTGSSGQVRFSKFVNGTETILKSTSMSNPSNNVFFTLNAKVVGSTFTVYVNGTQKLSVTDSTYTSGDVGIAMGSTGTVGSYRADNFKATVTGVPPPPPPPPPSPQCSDSIDNDADAKIDYLNDPGCTDTLDNDETDPAPPPPPPPPGAFNDDFNRSDSAAVGNGWTEVAGDLRILSNTLQDQSVIGFNKAVQTSLSGSTQTVSADFTKVGDSQAQFGILLRYQNAQNYYMVYRVTGSSNRINISKFVNGVETVLKYYVISNPSSGVPFRIEGRINGSTITAYLNGSSLVTATDSAFSTGSTGIYLGHGRGTSSQKADNFSATFGE